MNIIRWKSHFQLYVCVCVKCTPLTTRWRFLGFREVRVVLKGGWGWWVSGVLLICMRGIQFLTVLWSLFSLILLCLYKRSLSWTVLESCKRDCKINTNFDHLQQPLSSCLRVANSHYIRFKKSYLFLRMHHGDII